MENPTLYKKETLNNVNARTSVALTEQESSKAKTVVDKFFELFAADHL